MIRDYQTWRIWDRPFLLAMILSGGWHLLWFFSLTIVVSDVKPNAKVRPTIVSIGSVLDDSFLRTIVETRAEHSQTFYRPPKQLEKLSEISTESSDRFQAGEVVSVGNLSEPRNALSGQKALPEHAFISRLKSLFAEDAYRVDGLLKNRSILFRPTDPRMLVGYSNSTREKEVAFECTVDESGRVTFAQIVHSSSSPILDKIWSDYLKAWKFAPKEFDELGRIETGLVTLKISKQDESIRD